MIVKELNRAQTNKMAPEAMEALVKKMKKEHDKLIKGMFEFIDAQGGWLDFSYRFFKDDPLMTIRLMHGEICELPMGIVKHLNNCVKKVRTIDENLDKNGKGRGVPTTVTKTSRIRFTPMEVM